MPRPALRTRLRAKKLVKTPGGRLSLHVMKKKVGKARCAVCGAELHGVPTLPYAKFRNLSKTEKRPERPFGGVLCPECLRRAIVRAVRGGASP